MPKAYTLNPYLSLATANNRFSSFSIRPRRIKWISKASLAFLLVIVLILNYLSFFTPLVVHAAHGPHIEQQINILDSEMTNQDGSAPISVWKLDESSGTNAPDSVGANNGTLQNMEAADWVAGRVANALLFDGTNEYVSVADNATLDITQGTVTAWIKSDVTSQNDDGVIAKSGLTGVDGPWGFLVYSDFVNPIYNGLRRAIGCDVDVADLNWHYVAVTYDSSGIKVYVDGILDCSDGTFTAALDTNALAVDIGGYSSTSFLYPGTIDEVRVYDFARTEAQIQSDMNMTRGQDKGMVKIPTSKYSATASYYFEVVGKVTSGTGEAYFVYDGGTGSTSTGGKWVKMTGIGTTYSRVRSSAFTPSGDNLAYLNLITGTGVTIKAARIIIVQTNATSITDTEAQVEVGNNQTSTATSDTELTDKKIYLFDSSKFSPAPTINFEATIATTAGTSVGPNYATASSDCVNDTNIGTAAWTNPGNAFSDNTTYATVSVDGTTSNYIKCTNFGFSIPTSSVIKGMVVGVERKSSSTGNGGSNDAAMRIVKGGTIGSTDRSTTTTYTTSDVIENHGSSSDLWGLSWTVADINATNFGAAFAATKPNGAGLAHTVSVDFIRITVYYNPSTAYASLYTTTGTQVSGSEVSASSNTQTLARTASAITLSSGTAYVVRVRTSAAAEAASIASAKIILTQTDAAGITASETMQLYNNTLATDADSTYTSQDFDNEFNKANFAAGTFAAYFETTIKTSNSANAYFAQLDTPLGEVTGTDTSYTRKRNATDLWSSLPASATNIDVQLKNNLTDTTSSSTSWLIIQVSNLQIPENLLYFLPLALFLPFIIKRFRIGNLSFATQPALQSYITAAQSKYKVMNGKKRVIEDGQL